MAPQERSALLVGHRLVPDIHGPLVGGHIEQACLLAEGHRHPAASTPSAPPLTPLPATPSGGLPQPADPPPPGGEIQQVKPSEDCPFL